mmetsp:Transcript_8620/g.12174  ORF Transcript_8620/g.12174 Transcript_8620/m.12174 type:complete len:172 (+) Transcript_8620:50-565(+)
MICGGNDKSECSTVPASSGSSSRGRIGSNGSRRLRGRSAEPTGSPMRFRNNAVLMSTPRRGDFFTDHARWLSGEKRDNVLSPNSERNLKRLLETRFQCVLTNQLRHLGAHRIARNESEPVLRSRPQYMGELQNEISPPVANRGCNIDSPYGNANSSVDQKDTKADAPKMLF